MGHEPVLVPDSTLFIQLAIFFATYFVLKALVFNPFVALIEARHEKTVGLKKRAAEAKERAAKLQLEYETFMKAERKKVATWGEEERKKIGEEERTIIEAARTQVAAELVGVRASIHTEVEKARRDLLPLVTEFSSQIATKILGKKTTVSATLASSGSQPPPAESSVLR